MTKAAAYLRVSGLAQAGDDREGLARQELSCRAFAATNGYELIALYAEKGVSGRKDVEDRPAFQRMVAELLANGCRTVIVESLDRLAREYRVQELLLIYLASKEIALIAANTGENVTNAMRGDPMKRALVQIQGVFAELDKNLLVARLRKARAAKRAKNGKCEGRPRYGTEIGEDSTLQMMRGWRTQGMSYDAIAFELNRMERLPRKGRQWYASTIRKILLRN